MRKATLVLCLSTLLPACFLSSWPESDCDARPACGEGYSEVGVCSRRECNLETVCGRAVYCERDACDRIGCAFGEAEVPWCEETSSDCTIRATECGAAYCQSNLCNAFPSCDEGEEQVATCAGEDESCRSASVCGTTIFCASPCVIPQVCAPGQTQYSEACPPDGFCEEHRACGETVYCGEETICESAPPCFDATSPVLRSGEGVCPPVLPGPDPRDNCYIQNVCGALHFCVMACDVGHYIVSDPTECDEDGACYPASGEGVEVWCTGQDVNCEAEPFCEEEEIQMTVGEVCASDWRCRIVEACGAAIQCGHFVGDDD